MYHIEITVPKETSQDNPVEFRIPVGKGNISAIRVFFPWGCANLCGVMVLARTWQIMPLSRGVYLKGNDITYEHFPNYELMQEPYELVIKAYNDDDIFEHKPVISVDVSTNALSNKFKQFIRSIS